MPEDKTYVEQQVAKREAKREGARTALEDAVWKMLEAGYTPEQVRGEVDYAIEDAE